MSTTISCPHCGTATNTNVPRCAACRRAPTTIEIPLPGTCWQWHGPPDHLMRCRRRDPHTGPHDSKPTCPDRSCGECYECAEARGAAPEYTFPNPGPDRGVAFAAAVSISLAPRGDG